MSNQQSQLGRYKDMAKLLVKHRGLLSGPTEPDAGESLESARADAAVLARDLEELGPTFVKLGQVLSTRADLLPAPYLEALARLQDDVEPFGFALVEETVASELGVRMSDAFRSFDHEPVAAASLGQVHRAELRDGRPAP